MSLTPTDLSTIQRVSDAVSSLSLCGSLFIALTYVRFSALREKASFRFVFCLSVSDVCNHLFDFVGPSAAEISAMRAGEPTSAACYAQALGNAEFELSSVLWSTVIAAVLYSQVVLGVRQERVERAFVPISAAAWGVPLCLAILPLLVEGPGVYGASGSWCWIRGMYPGWVFSVFYLPLWAAMTFNCFAHVRIKRRLEAMSAGGALVGTDAATTAKLALVMERLKYYPFVLLVVWLPASISRIVEASAGRQFFGLLLFHRIFSSSQGLLNALAYGLSRTVREALHADLHSRCPGCVPPPPQQLTDAAVTEPASTEEAAASTK